MKSLLDIQQDIRNLEDRIQDISDNIKNINSDIERIRNSSELPNIDYRKIETLSQYIMFGKHPLNSLKNENTCKEYMIMLFQLIKLDKDEETTINRMIFLQWLLGQSMIAVNFEDLYIESLKSEKQQFFEFAKTLSKKYKEHFIVDALIVAFIGGAPNREIIQFIADMVTILGFSSDNVKLYAIVSKVALCQSGEGLFREDIFLLLDNTKCYKHYISQDIIDNLIISLREVKVSLHEDDVLDFKWKAKNIQEVNKGDLIATYIKRKSMKKNIKAVIASNIAKTIGEEYGKTIKIYAECSGTIFQFRDNNTYYGVIAHETDNKDSIKAWVKANRDN